MALTIKKTFDKVNVKFSFEDNTDYSSGFTDIDTAVPVSVIFRVEVNTAVQYENAGWDSDSFASPDLSVDISSTPTNVTTQNTSIPLPINNLGEVPLGDYIVKAKALWTNTAGGTSVDGVQEDTFTYTFEDPKVALTASVDCGQPLLTLKDETELTVDNVSPTTTTRSLKVTFPPDVSTAAQVTTSDALLLSDFYTGTNIGTVSTTLIYDLTGYSVQTLIEGKKDILVDCDKGLCDISCCLDTLWDKWRYAKNLGRKQDLLDDLVKATTTASLMEIAGQCQTSADISKYASYIKELTNCNGNCGCDSGASKLVSGYPAVTVTPYPQKLIYTSTGYSTLTVSALIGRSTSDFDLYVDGLLTTPSAFNSLTGLITFGFTVSSGVEVVVIIRK